MPTDIFTSWSGATELQQHVCFLKGFGSCGFPFRDICAESHAFFGNNTQHVCSSGWPTSQADAPSSCVSVGSVKGLEAVTGGLGRLARQSHSSSKRAIQVQPVCLPPRGRPGHAPPTASWLLQGVPRASCHLSLQSHFL